MATPHAERLALRKRIVAAAQLRRKPARVPAPKQPTGLILEHTKFLLAISRELDTEIWAALKEYGIRQDDERAVPRADVSSLVRSLRARLGRIASGNALKRRVEEFAKRAEKFSRTEFRKQIKTVLGIDLRGDPNLVGMFERWTDKNLALIVSLSQEKVSRVGKVLRAAGSTERVEQIAARIQDETGATESRAILIARDQTVKLNSQLAEAQHRHAGIVEFVWSTSRDERVRKSHRELDGRRFHYDDPPTVDGEIALPGQPVQCRCLAIPIMPGTDDA